MVGSTAVSAAPFTARMPGTERGRHRNSNRRLAAELLRPEALRFTIVGPFDDLAPFHAATTPAVPASDASAAR